MATNIIAVPFNHKCEPLLLSTIGEAMERFGFKNSCKFKTAFEDGLPVYTMSGDPDGGGRAYILDEALD